MKRSSKKVKSTGGCVLKLDKLIVLQGEAKKYNGDAGVDVANWEVVPTQVWGPRRCGAHAGELLASQQDNCDDCGVFTCIFSNYVSADLPFVFTAATSVSASPSAY